MNAIPVTTDGQVAHLHTVCGHCGTKGVATLRAHEAHAVATMLLSWLDRIPPLDRRLEGVRGRG
jgi:hypothetical protein